MQLSGTSTSFADGPDGCCLVQSLHEIPEAGLGQNHIAREDAHAIDPWHIANISPAFVIAERWKVERLCRLNSVEEAQSIAWGTSNMINISHL